jgi:hypothetical protein
LYKNIDNSERSHCDGIDTERVILTQRPPTLSFLKSYFKKILDSDNSSQIISSGPEKSFGFREFEL